MIMYGGIRKPDDMMQRLTDAYYNVIDCLYQNSSDHIHAYNEVHHVVINPVNGRFVVFLRRDDTVVATESSEKYDRDMWYRELCDSLYLPLEALA